MVVVAKDADVNLMLHRFPSQCKGCIDLPSGRTLHHLRTSEVTSGPHSSRKSLEDQQ